MKAPGPDGSTPPQVSALLAAAADVLDRAGIERPVFEAQVLLAIALGVRREDVLRGVPEPLDSVRVARFRALTQRREAREPMAYLRGTQEFYGMDLVVGPAVLVPRPETELLVDIALQALRPLAAPVVVDVGTGSGCLAVAIAANHPGARVLASDVSADVLEVARANAERHGVADRVHAVQADLLGPVAAGSADVVVSNPPYIASAEVPRLQAEVSLWEPRLALDGGADGLALVRRVVRGAARVLRPGGLLALEVAAGQAHAVEALLHEAGMRDVQRRRDLAGIDRVVAGRARARLR